MTAQASRIDFLEQIDFSEINTNPILDIAARVWEPDRYAAFQICYRSMRILDNLVDHRKSSGQPILPEEARQFTLMIDDFIVKLKKREADDQFSRDLLTTLDRFALPLWPWERLGKAMQFDLTHNGFPSFTVFLRYCEGAAISPAAVFMHLIGVRNENGKYLKPEYEIRNAARSLAIFSYLVHIMRDFSKDHAQGLAYFADDLLTKHQVTAPDLAAAAKEDFSPNFKSLVLDHVRIAERYRRKARRDIDAVGRLLEPRYHFSLELIYDLYLQLFERIQPAKGELAEARISLSAKEIEDRVRALHVRFFDLQK